jgi:hypothetical protein
MALSVEFEGVSFTLPKEAITAYAVRDGTLRLQISSFSGELVITKSKAAGMVAAAPLMTPAPAPRKRKVPAPEAAATAAVEVDKGIAAVPAANGRVLNGAAAIAQTADIVESKLVPLNPPMSAPSPRLKRAKPPGSSQQGVGDGSDDGLGEDDGDHHKPAVAVADMARKVTFAAQLESSAATSAAQQSGHCNDDDNGCSPNWELVTVEPRKCAGPAVTPLARWGSAVFLHGRKLVVYGGEEDSDDGHTVPRVAAFDLDAHTWEEFDGEGTGAGAAGRCWHTATYLPKNSSAIVFGGQAGDGGSDKAQGGGLVDEVMILDCDMMFWCVLLCIRTC